MNKLIRQIVVNITNIGTLTRDSFWTTREGVKIRVRDMDNSHLLNTIRMLQGQSPIGTRFLTTRARREKWIIEMSVEAARRGILLD